MLTAIINTYNSVKNQLTNHQLSLTEILPGIDSYQKTRVNILFPDWHQRLIAAREALNHQETDNKLAIIYDMEEIALACPKYHWQIMEILTNFVRNHTIYINQVECNSNLLPKISPDIQGALTVIGRRNTTQDQENELLDLSYTNIRGVNLNQANLQLTNLYHVDLSQANLTGVNLSGAVLSAANLAGANLCGANLQGAILSAANLAGANLCGANLQGANLYLANLEGANLRDATLQGANLREANLAVTDMTSVDA
jgi:hypothetical protein